MERRVLGQTGEELSIVGFGGIVVMNVEPPEASRLVVRSWMLDDHPGNGAEPD